MRAARLGHSSVHDDRSFEHALGKREPRTFGDYRPHSSSGCFAPQLIEHGQGGTERKDIAPKIREGMGHTARTRADIKHASALNKDY